MNRMDKNIHSGDYNSDLKLCVLNLTKYTISYNVTLL